MNEEVIKQVLKDARKIFVENKVLMDEHCRIIRVSIKDLEVLKANTDILPSVLVLARAVVTMEMVFEMNHVLPKAKECSSLAKRLAESLKEKDKKFN